MQASTPAQIKLEIIGILKGYHEHLLQGDPLPPILRMPVGPQCSVTLPEAISCIARHFSADIPKQQAMQKYLCVTWLINQIQSFRDDSLTQASITDLLNTKIPGLEKNDAEPITIKDFLTFHRKSNRIIEFFKSLSKGQECLISIEQLLQKLPALTPPGAAAPSLGAPTTATQPTYYFVYPASGGAFPTLFQRRPASGVKTQNPLTATEPTYCWSYPAQL